MENNIVWTWIGNISGLLGIISFFASLFSAFYTKTILRKIRAEQARYNEQREQLLISFQALQKSIWGDRNKFTYILLKLQNSFNEYKLKFWRISSIRCKFHVLRAIHNLKKAPHRIKYFPLKYDVIEKTKENTLQWQFLSSRRISPKPLYCYCILIKFFYCL